MFEIFLSYAKEDRSRAKIFVEALEQQKYSVWWDGKILPGESFDKEIEKQLKTAKCVIVLWSRESVKSDWVKEEAHEGKKRGILCPVLIDEIEIPIGFRTIHAASMIDWQRELPHQEFDSLLESVRQKIGSSMVVETEENLLLSDPKTAKNRIKNAEEKINEDLIDLSEDTQNASLKRLTTILDYSKVFFVGDEISKKYGVSNFKDFTIEIIKFITQYNFNDDECDELRNYLRSEIALLILYDELGPKVLFCFEEYYNYEPKPIHYYVANEIKKGKIIFTTNRDNLIEEACNRSNINLEGRIIYKVSEFEKINKKSQNLQSTKMGYLIKLNGSCDQKKVGIKKFKTLLDSLKQVGKGLNLNKKKVLVNFIKNFDFCFLGYSCFEDFIVYPILKATETDKAIFWFNYEEKHIEIISEKEHINTEIEREEINLNRNLDIININSILLKRKKFVKINGDWIEFINGLFPSLDTNQCVYVPPIKNNENSKVFAELRNSINSYERHIILGILWEKCLSKEKAIKFFEDAEKLSTGENRAKAKLSLAKVYHRLYGSSEAKSVMKNYLEAFQIFMEEGYILEAAQCKIGWANFNRKQLNKISEAFRICEEIKLMLERIKEKNSKYKFVFAQYLNTLGLVYMDLRIDKLTDQCINLFEDSIKYRLEIKDVEGEAETENYLGLFIRNKNNKVEKVVKDAITHLEKALEIRKSIGDYIGVAQTCRNLGLCYTDLIKITENDVVKKKYIHIAKEIYEEGLNYWYIMKGDPPIKEKLELQYRLGELEINHGDINLGIKLLVKVEKERDKIGDWHNRARALDLLCKAYKSQEYYIFVGKNNVKSTAYKIISIYRNVLEDYNKIAQMKDDPKKFENAVQIIQRIKEITKNIEYVNEKILGESNRIEKELDLMLENLKRMMSSELDPTIRLSISS